MDWEPSKTVIILDINDDKDRSGQAMFSCIVKHEITDWRAQFTSVTVRHRVDLAMLKADEVMMLH